MIKIKSEDHHRGEHTKSAVEEVSMFSRV
ncbi:DUF1471 domain-containing protein, partial [Escherichia coli]|nr:DUF1471 domain-containing protein [Escherichia coli]EGX8481649.1 DUF1471 domain-containing protein [Escherichia coli]HAX6642604.1 DUF1471 domain-containing protein [Escherichia coli]